MINRRFFIQNFYNNSKIVLSSSWEIIIRALVFSFLPKANFSLFEYLCFLFFQKNSHIITKFRSFNYALLCFNTTKRSYMFLVIQLETINYYLTKNFGRNIERVFCCCRDLKMYWLQHF